MSRDIQEQVFDSLIPTLGDSLNASWEFIERFTESPIETALIAALVMRAKIGKAWYCHIAYSKGNYDRLMQCLAPKSGPSLYELVLWPQATIGRYRLDLLVSFSVYGKTTHLAVECDGHDFHEKTKEQAARDKRRDRECILSNITVLRFTDSEIYQNASACAEDIVAFIESKSMEIVLGDEDWPAPEEAKE